MAIQIQYTFLLLLISTPELQQASAELIREQGYSVSTVLDGNKLPHRLIFSSALVTHDTNELLILDSPNSVFYTISIPISNGSQINKFAGNGTRGFADGGLTMAMFDRPLNFAVDMNGIVYVADRKNRAIRKITKSGVTTIAGGHSGNPGNVDGPALEASFSDDFDLIFVRELCALLILDRGNGLIRQMNLDPNDCRNNYKWKLGVLGVAILSVKYFIFVVALGLFFGLFVYPCVIGPRGNRRHIMQEISVISPDNESLPTRSVQTEVDANVSKFGRLLTWKPSLWQPLAGSLGLVKRNRS